MVAGTPKLNVDSLRAWYGSDEVIHGISFDVRENEIFGIIGPAQSGKTTLLKIINRTLEFTTGSRMGGLVEMDGQDVYHIKDVYGYRRRVGMVAPLPVGLPLSIYDNVAFAPRSFGMEDKKELDALVQKCLEQAALWDEVKDRLNDSALRLSGGQQQRLCIARAVAVEPEVLLMDEPCSALDPLATARIEELMVSLKEKYTIVVVTHNMQQAARISDYTGFLLLGELIEFGQTEKLFTRPADSRTEDYITGRFG